MPTQHPGGHIQTPDPASTWPPTAQQSAFVLEGPALSATPARTRMLATARRIHQPRDYLTVPLTWQKDSLRLGSALENARARRRSGRTDPALLRGLEQLGSLFTRAGRENNVPGLSSPAPHKRHADLLPFGDEKRHHAGHTITITSTTADKAEDRSWNL